MRLTKRMVQVLKTADVERGVVNDVPMSTLWGLQDRGLAKQHNGVFGRVTGAGRFPHYNDVRLTEAGIRAARGLLGMTPLPVPGRAIQPNI